MSEADPSIYETLQLLIKFTTTDNQRLNTLIENCDILRKTIGDVNGLVKTLRERVDKVEQEKLQIFQYIVELGEYLNKLQGMVEGLGGTLDGTNIPTAPFNRLDDFWGQKN